jgi:plastocyanin
MKKTLFFASILILATGILYSAQYTITNSGTTFSPDSISINPGDTVIFELGGAHNAVEVSAATYLANGNTSNGGFELPFGGGTVTFPDPGIHYFVCFPHASMGMKGIINVSGSTALSEKTDPIQGIIVSPNPATDYFNLAFTAIKASDYSIWLSDITGATISVLSHATLTSGLNKQTFMIDRTLSPGLYFVYLTSGENTYTSKLVIQ